MTDPMREDELRDLLTERARSVTVPEPPLDDLVATGARAERRRGRLLLGSTAAAVVLAIAAGAAIADWPRHDGAPTPSKEPTSTPSTGIPRSLADLPAGRPSDLPFAGGQAVHYRDRSIALPRVPSRVGLAGTDVVVQYDDFSIDLVEAASGRIQTVTTGAAGPFVVTGDQVIYQRDDSKATVVVHDLEDGTEVELAFPVSPSCCDNPFQIAGADGQGRIVAGTASDGTWAWDYPGDDGGSEPGALRRISGLGDRRVVAVTATEIVAEGPDGYDIGQLEDGRYAVTDHLGLPSPAYFGLSDAIVYADQAGALHAHDRTSATPEDVQLRLPPLGEDLPVMYPEDASHVLLQVPAGASGLERDAQVRCDVRDGACEIAGWFDPVDVGSGPVLRPEPGLVDPSGTVEAMARAFVAMAEGPTPETVGAVPFAATVRLGLGADLRDTARKDLTTADGWRRTPRTGYYAGRSGTIELLAPLRDHLASAESDPQAGLLIGSGPHPVCAAPPVPIDALDALRQVSLRPAEGSFDSCLDWFSIDLFLDDDDEIAAVVLQLYEP